MISSRSTRFLLAVAICSALSSPSSQALRNRGAASDIFVNVDPSSQHASGDGGDDGRRQEDDPPLTFHGIGAISGGGATSRLLVDYPEPQRSEILDVLFKPGFAASLHILKVEIGGDSQSTDGTEPSHMHSVDDLDCTRGYEWWLLKEAKKRNPDIITYGLPWEFPGWPNENSGEENPFQKPDLTVRYVIEWLKCARDAHGVDVDLLGLWNEKGTAEQGEGAYVTLLRQTLDDEGFADTKIVAKDGVFDVCNELAADPEYLHAVHAVGLHYPSDYNPGSMDACHKLRLPVWAAEECSSYADENGAACWARVLASHFVLSGITSSIMWNLVGSYTHATNWYASSLFRADQPWTGYYDRDDDAPVVWATAHYTQFTQPGWRYLPVGTGSGELPGGGFYTSLVSPDGQDFTLVAVKISRDHASCTRPLLPDFDVQAEQIKVHLSTSIASKPLHVWRSNFEASGGTFFEHIGVAHIEADGSTILDIQVGDIITLSTVGTAQKGTFATEVPQSDPKFPLPHADDFEGYTIGQEASYFADQVGVWEVHPEVVDPSTSDEQKPNLVMRQMVPSRPIGGIGDGTNSFGPVSVIGISEFNDLCVSTRFRLPISSSTDQVSACVGARMHQYGDRGTVLCVAARGNWTLSYGGPSSGGGYPANRVIVMTGRTPRSVGLGVWHELELVVDGSNASGSLDGSSLFSSANIVDINSGFASIGTNMWGPVEFDDFHMSLAVPSPPRQPPQRFQPGQLLGATPCARNGDVDPRQSFLMKANWQLFHVPSGLCAEAGSTSEGSSVRLASCRDGAPSANQQFRNDYSKIRHSINPVTLGAYKMLPDTLTLVGYLSGVVAMMSGGEDEDWNKWTYYPNTGQVRNVQFANAKLGFPSCLAVLDDRGMANIAGE